MTPNQPLDQTDLLAQQIACHIAGGQAALGARGGLPQQWVDSDTVHLVTKQAYVLANALLAVAAERRRP